MKRLCLFLVLATAMPAMALTKAERSIVQHAYDQLEDAIKFRDEGKREATLSRQSALDAFVSAQATEARAVTAEKQADEEHRQLVGCKKDYDRMKPIVDRVNSYWGIGGILYGFGRLAKHLLILVAVLALIAIGLVVASLFFPVLAPVLSAAESIWLRLFSLFKRKP